jgi:glutathione S-transferase
MNDFTLTIGNCNYSSWSMRAWLALRLIGAAFREDRIWFDQDGDRKQRLERSPAGRVPILRHESLVIWDSLAICEYLAELYPRAGLWPSEAAARARARSLCCEMHAGFEALRTRMPFNSRARRPFRDRGEAVAREVERIREMWTETRREHGRGGAFLFGSPGIVDAYYAPVAGRFRTYGVRLEGEAGTYLDALLDWDLVREWSARAEAEPQTDAKYDRLTAEA